MFKGRKQFFAVPPKFMRKRAPQQANGKLPQAERQSPALTRPDDIPYFAKGCSGIQLKKE